jgi:WhiB family redox-sensing transcriptional regulator
MMLDLVQRLAWMDHAACANKGAKQPRVDFFPKIARNTNGYTTATREAKAICQRCCVRDECLAYALATENHQRHGIWGGMTPEERAEILR